MKTYMKSVLITLLLASIVLLAKDAAGQAVEMKDKKGQNINQNDLDGIVEFYGIVSDQHGSPVSNAIIACSYIFYSRAYDNHRSCQTFSEKDGTFKIVDIHAGIFGVDEIKCAGYETAKFNESYRYSLQDPKKFIPDAKNPVVFKIRKLEAKPEYIFKNSLHGKIEDPDETYLCDFILNNFWPESLSDNFMNDISKPDMKIRMKNIDKGKEHVLVFSIPDKDSGMLEKKELLFTAPLDGYQNEITLKIPYGTKDYKTTFYMKGRGGRFYSMIETAISYSEEIVSLEFKTSTNPNSSRNLEEDKDMPSTKWEEMEKKVRSDFGYP